MTGPAKRGGVPWPGRVGALLLAGLAAWSQPVSAGPVKPLPVLLVHGIDDDHRTMLPLQRHLAAQGWHHLKAIDLVPNDGTAGIDVLAGQVDRAAQALMQETGSPRVDVVGFSMGALVSRYWMQQEGGKRYVRRFVSLAGPHQGTWAAYTRANAGGRQMRPGSALLVALDRDADPWGEVQVWSFWTPYDLVIVPASSSVLPRARHATFPVLLHPWMLTDERVLRAVSQALGEAG